MATFDWDGNRKSGRSPFATYTDSPAYNIQSRSLGNEAKGSNIPFSDILGKASAIGSGITGIFGSVNSLATPQTLEVMLVYNGTSYCAYALGGKY